MSAAHDRLALREAAEQRDERQLVDRERHLFGLDRRPDERPGGDVEVGDRLGARDRLVRALRRRLEVAEHDRAHPLEDPQEPGPRPVHVHIAQQEPRPRHDHARRDPERRRADVVRHCDRLELQLVGVHDVDARPVAFDRHAGGDEHPLGVVTARCRLDDGRAAASPEPGEQHARLDLRARNRQRVLDPGEVAAGDRERREAPLGRLDRRAHQPQRLGDPVDRAPADRGVAVERPALALGSSRASPAADASACPRCRRRSDAGRDRGAQPDAANRRSHPRCSRPAHRAHATAASVERVSAASR